MGLGNNPGGSLGKWGSELGGGGSTGGVDIGVRANSTSNQSIPSGVHTAVTLGAEVYDASTGMHDVSTNNNRITFHDPGKYIIGAAVSWQASVSSGILAQNTRLLADIRYNADTTGVSIARMLAGASSEDGRGFTLTAVYDVSSGDFVSLTVFQDSTHALTIFKDEENGSIFWAQKVLG